MRETTGTMGVAAAVWVALAVLVLPGFLVAWISGLKTPAAMFAGMPVTFGIVGLAAWFWGLTELPFDWVTFILVWLVVLALAGVWRFMFAMKARRNRAVSWVDALWPGGWRRDSIVDPTWIVPTIGVVTSAWLQISAKLRWLEDLPHGMGNIFQGWDVQWHANAVRFILEEGIASPSRMGELQNIESQAQMLYPSGFHATTALIAEATGWDPIEAVNLMSIVAPAIALPLTMVGVVAVVVGTRSVLFQLGAAIAAIGVYASPVLTWIGDYVGAWPYLAAVALTGVVIAQFVGVVHRHVGAFATTLGFLGVVQLHPSAVTIVALAVGLYWLVHVLFSPAQTRLRDFIWLVAPAATGVLMYLPQLLSGSEQTEEVSSFVGDESDTLSEAWADSFLMNTRHVDDFFVDWDPTVVLWLALVGALCAVVWRRQVWLLVTYLFFLVIAVVSLYPVDGILGEAATAVGALHYNMAHRLIMPVAIIVFAMAGLGVAVLIRLLTLAPVAVRKGSRGWRRATTAASIVVGLLVGWGAVWWVTETTDYGAQEAFEAPRAEQRMVNDDDRAAFDWLATQPAAYEGLTMGEPADGHSWIYAYNGVPTVSRHYMWPTGGRGSNTDALYWEAHLLGEGKRGAPDAMNEVDEAAAELNVKFYVTSPWSFWAFQKPRWEMLHGLWTADGATPVYRKGNTVIFAVNEAFAPYEIALMQSDAQKAGSDPLPSNVAAVEGLGTTP
ncbi:DUF6541 family protein [Corynebacterium cystitidis]|uniref:DUF6541 family protein n=1 Tax=Corynebacterium cystitidis TaxID=35757 RepID=UPI00211F2966|nr:DUF6541 family protein [Corynebacterium cystitidis]